MCVYRYVRPVSVRVRSMFGPRQGRALQLFPTGAILENYIFIIIKIANKFREKLQELLFIPPGFEPVLPLQISAINIIYEFIIEVNYLSR